jgi:hypothetical protein
MTSVVAIQIRFHWFFLTTASSIRSKTLKDFLMIRSATAEDAIRFAEICNYYTSNGNHIRGGSGR